MSDVKFKSVWAWSHFSVHESFNSFVNTIWTVGVVFSCWIHEAYETVFTNLSFLNNERFNGTEWSKEFSNLLIGHGLWDILEIKIVD